jgi:hypothetical protein
MNRLRGKNSELPNIKSGGPLNKHIVLKGKFSYNYYTITIP